MEYFKGCAEDYNTGTLTYLKYHNYKTWEIESMERTGVGEKNVALYELRHNEEMVNRTKKQQEEEVKMVQYDMVRRSGRRRSSWRSYGVRWRWRIRQEESAYELLIL